MNQINTDGKIINITHGEKTIFHKMDVTKWDIINYYLKISDLILPYIQDRLITISCFMNGISNQETSYKYSFTDFPSWFQTFWIKNKIGWNDKCILCQDQASLIYLLNHDMVSIFRSLSKLENLEMPDILILAIKSPKLQSTRNAAKLAKFLLEKEGYQPHVMSVGLKELYVISKVKYNESYINIKNMLNKFASIIQTNHANKTFLSNKNSIQLNITFNNRDKSAIAPYSIIADEQASIATPLYWSELDDDSITFNKHNINNIFTRLNNLKKDPWHGLDS